MIRYPSLKDFRNHFQIDFMNHSLLNNNNVCFDNAEVC